MSSVSKFLDGTDLNNSTAVYDDVALTTKASDGYYSNGAIVREQVNGLLLPAASCPACVTPLPCAGSSQFPGGNTGVYVFSFDVGNTASDVGAIVVTFRPFSVPDGLKVTFNTVVYNGFTSNTASTGGWKQSSNANNRTYVGSSNATGCNTFGAVPSPLPYSATVDLYNYQTASSWLPAVGTTTLTVESGDTQLESAATDASLYTMVIPKTTTEPSRLDFDVASYCTSTGWELDVTCPAALPSFTMGTNSSTAELACSGSTGFTGYRAGGGDTGNTPLLFDLVFSDPNGQNKLSQGFYGYSSGYFEVDTNGVIVTIGSCPP